MLCELQCSSRPHTLLDDEVARLEDLEAQAQHDLAHEVGVGVREEGHRGDERLAVERHNLLAQAHAQLAQDVLLVEHLALLRDRVLYCTVLTCTRTAIV